MLLILVRHGPTEWNALDRFQGRSDIPLSPEGRIAAQAIATALGDEPIDTIYSSDLVRAVETARIIAAARGTRILTDARLREFDFGSWEGLTWEEIAAGNPQLCGESPTAAKLYAPEGGETFAQVRARVQSFLDDLQAEDADAHRVIVTHAGPLHAFLSVLGLADSGKGGLDFDRFVPGSITRVTLDGRHARLVTLNDLEHLATAG